MASYRFPPVLTMLAWEAELQRGAFAAERAWSAGSPPRQLHLDFSRVESVDFAALASALLLLDAAVKRGVRASVTLPATFVFPSERRGAGPTLASRRARARGDALAFMRQVGFVDSLRAPHWRWDSVRVLDRAAAGAAEPGPSGESTASDSHDARYRRRRVFPFQWLEPMPAAQLRESESFVTVSAGLEDLGLTTSDARTLSQTVLTELVENVAEHGSDDDSPPVALVGAILLSAETYQHRQNGMHAHMAEVAERAVADGSNVLRLIVADSGADLAARLAPDRGRHGTDRGRVPDRRRQETILAALGNRAASSATGVPARRGTTGLWWVARVVRSYHGAVQARTADLLVGRLFGRDEDGTSVATSGFSHVPGTLLEITLPTGPSLPQPRMSWGSLSAPDTVPDLLWVDCAFDPQRGLADADRARLTDVMHDARQGQHPDGLVVTVPLHDAEHKEIDDRWRGAIYKLLEYASSIARWGIIVVAFLDAEPHLLSSCVAAFNEDLASTYGEDAHDPILVLGRDGEALWCGGSVPLRAVLQLLLETEGSTDAVAARNRWEQAGGQVTGLSGALSANGHLLTVSSDRLKLRLSLSAVHETVAGGVSRQLAQVIEYGGDGVDVGIFRAPTLWFTNRWIDIEELLTNSIGVQLAAFLLARKVEMTVRASAQPDSPTEVVQVRSAPRLLARHLSECLVLGGRYYPQQSELNIGEPSVGEQVPNGAKVILCTDLICTENTVRRAVAMVAGRDADPLAIACVVDARDARGPVRMLNRIIPVVSLAEVEIGFSGSTDKDITDIDPLMLRPDRTAPEEPGLGKGVDLLSWFRSTPDALRLGHIDTPPNRHFSAFIRLQAMRQQEKPDVITQAIFSNLRTAFTDFQLERPGDSIENIPIAIWYVASDGSAGDLAVIVRDHLASDGFQVTVTPVPRWTDGDSWVFPTSLSDVTDHPTGVLIVHWWAITGSTLRQLVRLASISGASWIVAVCVLNQLESNDAGGLQMLRAVSAPTAVADGDYANPARDSLAAPSIPVAIRFVADSSISPFDGRRCPMCVTQERYRLDDEAAPPRLINHAQELRDLLRLRELDEVARDSAADLFTVPVTDDEAIDYLYWRGLLLRARRTVSGRQEVIDRLRALTAGTPPDKEWTSAGLIRLLAAEQQWLQLPPLHFDIAAGLLSQICLDSFQQLTAPSWLRVQALMVMSAAVPQHLVNLLPRLLVDAGNEAVLIDHMLLEGHRLLMRPPGNSPIDVEQLRHSLLSCREYLEEQRATPHAIAVEDHLHAIRNLLTIADYRILRKPKDAQSAWERLQEDLVRPVVRHRLEAELLLVRNFVEDIERVEPSAESARAASADWDTCARQLEERALVNLPPLREILDGDFVADWLGRREQQRLLSLARSDVGELRAVTERLHKLSHGAWRPADPSWQAARRELLDRINWWNRVFLAAHQPDHDMPALLVELIRSIPVDIAPHVGRQLGTHHAVAEIDGPEQGEVKVFCPEKLLDQVVAHLLENLDKHRAGSAVCRLRVEYTRPDEGTVQMVVRNSGTVPCRPPGRGLKALDDKLAPFGGSLTGRALTDGGWSFASVLTLQLWRGA